MINVAKWEGQGCKWFLQRYTETLNSSALKDMTG